MALPATSKLTYEDYCLFPEDGRRHELIDGEHWMSPAPFLKHQRIVAHLTRILDGWAEENATGSVFPAPVDVVLSPVDVVQPDLVYVSAGRAEILTEANIQGAPDLVVEILSGSTRRHDLVVKRRLYERFEVAEYWVIDPDIETVTVWRLVGGELARAAELSTDAPALGEASRFESPLLPGLSIALEDLFG